ncbi:MAG: complex I NDUFA9 subunit family protein [Aeromicrobium sp.]|nr:complex I NDUFA9 subunit family protein [Burkholderiales bacterium]
MKKVLLLGGSGFIGSAIAEALTKRGDFVTVPTRDRERAKHLLLLPTCDVVSANIRDPNTLDNLIDAHDVVINLVGILHGDFEAVHVKFPALVAEACARHHVQRLVHMSAIGADIAGPSEYLRSRGRGEAAVQEIAKRSGLAVTVFRPSVVYGEKDKFLNMFMGLVKLFPVIPLGSPDATFQVVWVQDVARALTMAIDMPETIGKTYPLVGPKVYTLRQLIEFVIRISGRRRMVIGLGAWLSALQATVFEFLPGKIMTRDNVASMQIPNTSSEPFPAIFGRPAVMEDTVYGYMHQGGIVGINGISGVNGVGGAGGRGRYQHFREGIDDVKTHEAADKNV